MAVYLVHWNAPKWCAESVATLRGPHIRVSVVNNGGDLDLPEDVCIVSTGFNLGFSAAANLGLRLGLESDAPYLFIGCHDVRLAPGSMDAMVGALERDRGLGILGPVLDAQGSSESDLDWISGTGMLIRREVAESVQFDERFGSYNEDVDFCFRTRDLGWRVGRSGGAHAVTAGSVDSRRATVLMHSNSLVFFQRRRMWRQFVLRLMFLARQTMKSLLQGSTSEAWLYSRALLRGLSRCLVFPIQRPDRVSRRHRLV